MSKCGMVYYDNNMAGHITETDDGYEFKYHDDYLNSSFAKPVSLVLPLRQAIYKSKMLFAFFDGLIPEGWLLDIATDHWKIKANDRFELLLHACRDTVGAVSIIREEE